jgi:hypothetical protein
MECNICLEKITNEFIYTNCNCKHKLFHSKCLQKWLNMSRSCPFCKIEYTISPYEAKNEKSLLEKALFLDSINRFPSHYINNRQLTDIYATVID